MKDLEKDVVKAIEQHLPAQVGKILQERLKKIEILEEDLRSHKEELQNKNIQIETLNKKLEEYRDKDKRNETLEVREKAVEEKEKRQEVELLTLKVSEAEKRADMVSGFMNGLVRNTNFRKTVIDSVGEYVPVPNGNGGHIQAYSNSTKSYTENSEEV